MKDGPTITLADLATAEPAWLTFLLFSLAVYTVARLVVSDEVWGPTRRRLQSWLRAGTRYKQWAEGGEYVVKWGPGFFRGKAAQALDCERCTGFWTTGALAAVIFLPPRLYDHLSTAAQRTDGVHWLFVSAPRLLLWGLAVWGLQSLVAMYGSDDG